MVEPVGDIESEFGVDTVVLRTFTHGAFDVDDQIAGDAFFAGDRLAAETDDIGGMVFAEEFAVVLCDAGIIRQQQRDFLPDGFRVGGFQRGGELSGQPTDCRQIDPAFLPVYQGCFHL